MRSPARPALSAVLVVVVLLALARPALAADDPLRGQQWHLDAVSATTAWEHSRGAGITVAVVDTGVEADHPDLAGQVLDGYDATDPGTTADDLNGHGTLVAGVVAAVTGNGEGGAGLAPDASILPVRVLDGAGRGDPDEVADGIRWAADRGADVINLSFVEVPGATDGLLDGLGLIDREVEDAIRHAYATGAVVVGAAGNESADAVPYANDLPMIVTGASDQRGRRWRRSNADDGTLFAPGVDIVSTWTAGRYAEASGTSFAAPVVAAGAAMLLDLGVAANDVGSRLAATAVAPEHPGSVAVVDLGAAAEEAAAGVTASSTARPSDADGSPRTVAPAAGDDAAPSVERPDPGGDRADAGDVAANDQLTMASEGRPALGPAVVAWALLSTVTGGHVAVRRARLLDRPGR